MLGVPKPGALNYYTLFRLFSLTLFISKNLTLIYLPLSGSLDSLLCNPMASTPDLVFFLLMSQTLVAASSFSSSRAYSSLSLLDPYSDYVEVNISLYDFSSLSFLNVYAPPIRSSTRDSRTNFFFFSLFFPPMWKRKRWIFRASASASASSEKVPLPPLPLPHPCFKIHRKFCEV